MVGEGPGPESYRDPASARKQRRLRTRAIVFAIVLVIIETLAAYLIPLGSYPPRELLLVASAMAALAVGICLIVFLYWTWTAPVAVHANGITFPFRTRDEGGRKPFFVPFQDMVWAYADPSLPLSGIKVGLTSGAVAWIPFRILSDPRPVIDALRARVSMRQEDPEVEETIGQLDALPGAYVRVWEPRPAYEMPLVTVAVVALLVCAFCVFPFLPFLSLSMVQALVVMLGVTAAVLSAAWITERVVRPRFYVANLRVPDADRDVLLRVIAGFLPSGDKAIADVERKGILGRTRLFRIESLGAELTVSHQSRTQYEPAYWTLRLRYPVEKEAAVGAFLASFTRYAIEVGMISARDWRIGEVLDERRGRVRGMDIEPRR